MVVTLAAIASLGRLFDSTDYLAPLVTTAIAAHGSAIVLRRTRLGPIAVVLVAVAPGAVVLGWIRYLDTTFLGLPSTETFSLARQDLRDAWTQFGEVVAPAPALPGFVLGACIAVWVAAWVADWAAFRLGSAVEAVLPASASWCSRPCWARTATAPRRPCSSSPPRSPSSSSTGWPTRWPPAPGWATAGARARRRVVAVGSGHGRARGRVRRVRRPRVPGAHAEAMLDWHGGGIGDGTRVTVSPLVDIRKRLVDQSDVEAFTVRADAAVVLAAHRARQLRRDRLVLQRQLRARPTATCRASRRTGPTPVVQDYVITGLQAIWLPAAYQPLDVQTNGADVRYDTESSTLIVDNDLDTSDGVNYRVTSALPQLDVDLLDQNEGTDLPGADPRPLPPAAERLPRSVSDLAEAIMLGAGRTPTSGPACSRTGSAASSPTTSAASAPGTARTPSRTSSSRSAATASSSPARSRRWPGRGASPPGWRWASRPGEVDEDERRHRYIVRGRNAHAWPEVWINQAGWVPFEPTPGRGAPGAEEWTGVAEQQDDQDPIATTIPPSTPSTGAIPTTLPDETPEGPNEVDF